MAPPRRRASTRRPPQLNAAVGRVYRAKVQWLCRALGRTQVAVMQEAIDCYLGERPPISTANRHLFDGIRRQEEEAGPPRKKRGRVTET